MGINQVAEKPLLLSPNALFEHIVGFLPKNAKEYFEKFYKGKAMQKEKFFSLTEQIDLEVIAYQRPEPSLGLVNTNFVPCLVDAPYHLLLVYKLEPYTLGIVGVATVGFSFSWSGSSILVQQIQGYQSKSNGKMAVLSKEIFANLRWEKMLITLLEQTGKMAGFRKIKIRKARWNRWRGHRDSSLPLSRFQERLKIRYDITAQRMKYQPQLFSKYWVKNLV